ncbi:hypothetical protein ABC345_21215 [Shouchella sp. 1P09AA]
MRKLHFRKISLIVTLVLGVSLTSTFTTNDNAEIPVHHGDRVEREIPVHH